MWSVDCAELLWRLVDFRFILQTAIVLLTPLAAWPQRRPGAPGHKSTTAQLWGHYICPLTPNCGWWNHVSQRSRAAEAPSMRKLFCCNMFRRRRKTLVLWVTPNKQRFNTVYIRNSEIRCSSWNQVHVYAWRRGKRGVNKVGHNISFRSHLPQQKIACMNSVIPVKKVIAEISYGSLKDLQSCLREKRRREAFFNVDF